MRRQSKNHPSIVTLTAEPATPLGYSILIAEIDQRTAYDTLVEGELTLLQGAPKSGRTSKLLDIAAYNTQWGAITHQRQVLIATVEHDPLFVLDQLRSRDVRSESALADHVRIARVRTSGELALFVAQVASDGSRPGLLLIDDLGLLDTDDEDRIQAKSVRTAALLGHGSIADAVRYSTGVPYGAFSGLKTDTATVAPMAVLATVRAPRDGSRWGNHASAAAAHFMFGMDGEVFTSRRPLTDPAS